MIHLATAARAPRVLGSFVLLLAGCFGSGCSGSSSPTPARTDGGKTGTDSGPVIPDSPHALIGEACKANADCDTGLKCATEDPNGQCFKECKASTDADCGDIKLYACSFEGHCYARCTTMADCARADEGYVCKDDKPVRAGTKFCDVK